MKLVATPLDGVALIELTRFGDERGSFAETYSRPKLEALGIEHPFVQDNESFSAPAGTVRGLHYQLRPHEQGKLIRCLRGAIVDVAVDLRPTSPTYGEHARVELTADDDLVMWIAPGFAHGFCTTAPETVVAYKATDVYAPDAERAVHWLDPDLAIDWPVSPEAATVSAKDAAAPSLAEARDELP